MSVLGLDLATATGWAIHHPGGAVSSGVWHLKGGAKKSSAVVAPGVRPLNLWRRLSLVPAESIGLVVYEAAIGRGQLGGAAAALAHQLAGVLLLWCETHGLAYEAIYPGTLKKFATGSGAAKKPEMIAAAESVIGRKVADDNEADAVHLARYGAAVVLEQGAAG